MKEQLFTKVLCTAIAIIISQCMAYGQGKLIGGPCEGCEAVFEFENRELTSVDTLPEFHSQGTRIKITGTVYKSDGKTPAEGVIMYVYHTNDKGVYPKKGKESGWARRHGYLRGWVKTNKDGRYSIYTQKPQFYGTEPAHIHLTILEPNGAYYYVQDFLFEGDKRLSDSVINNPTPRGGYTGIMKMSMADGILTGKRDIILGRNIN